MNTDSRAAGVAIIAVVLALASARPAAKTEITIQYDKKFSFAGLRTWAWHPDGAGDVRLALTAKDDPKRVAARVDPIIIPTVERELGARGLTRSDGQSDLYLHYYVLGTVGQAAQVHGQFLPATPEWGIPPFTASTSALSIYPMGTLIIDITSPVAGGIVWRGAAAREIDLEKSDDE